MLMDYLFRTDSFIPSSLSDEGDGGRRSASLIIWHLRSEEEGRAAIFTYSPPKRIEPLSFPLWTDFRWGSGGGEAL